MDTSMAILLLVVLVVVAGAVWYAVQRQRSRRLRQQFGPEYERQLNETGDPRRAERVLERRAERVEHLQIQPLTSEDRNRFAAAWKSVQAHFVDDPQRAIAEADRLVTEVMRVRGYPISDFEQRAADVSVDHPAVVEHYRQAYEIARRSARGEASTEDLRQAMVHYRALFDDLLGIASVPGA